jgi:hypothetical protein
MRFIGISILVMVSALSMAQQQHLLPAGFEAPYLYENDKFTFSLIIVNELAEEFIDEAYLNDHYKMVYPVWSWPSNAYSLNATEDLQSFEPRHKSPLVYAIKSAIDGRFVGNLYILSGTTSEYDADINIWFGNRKINQQDVDSLYGAIRQWIAEDWPFINPQHLADSRHQSK